MELKLEDIPKLIKGHDSGRVTFKKADGTIREMAFTQVKDEHIKGTGNKRNTDIARLSMVYGTEAKGIRSFKWDRVIALEFGDDRYVPAKPSVIQMAFLRMQVCVPKDWTDEQVIAFAESENPCGTDNGWPILKDGIDPERVQCEDLENYVHIVLMVPLLKCRTRNI